MIANQTASLSPSSETPETAAFMLEHGRAVAAGTTRPSMWAKMKELELQRNAALKFLRPLVAECVKLEKDPKDARRSDLNIYAPTWKTAVAAHGFILENVKGVAPLPAGADVETGVEP